MKEHARVKTQKKKKLRQQQEKTRIIAKKIENYICKRCKSKHENNIKFHEYMRTRHAKKLATKLVLFIFKKLALFVTFSQIFSKSSIISSFISSFISFSTLFIILFTFIEFILFATSKKQIFWAKIASKSIISSKFSRLSFSILELFRNASISLFTFSSTFSSTSISTRFYITMNNLFVIFNEKSKSLNLSHRQMNAFSQYHWQFNKLVIFIFHQTRITSYFLSSFNSFKFNVLSKSKFCLFIQTSASRRRIFFCKQNINFASRIALFFDRFVISHISRHVSNHWNLSRDRQTKRFWESSKSSFAFKNFCFSFRFLTISRYFSLDDIDKSILSFICLVIDSFNSF